ncbi:MAG: 2,3-bisphosphoglycerate-independent phosphoglycerate mutase [Bacilli bacterium]|nr:2,3-bisphosphoglycerate-independent phosphoglycerate mutase [Bacilli bacterium]
MKPIVLCILDGVGMRSEVHGNAFQAANTPNFDALWNDYPHSLLEASGRLVGLPLGQMGNSEVGHMNIGAGRIVYQPLELLNKHIAEKTIYQNQELLKVIHHVKENHSALHLFGLLSDGGIHSHIDHLMGLLDMIKEHNIENVFIHVFTDGRDTLPDVALSYIEQLEQKLKHLEFGSIATISGRYYAMDRDNRWDRVEKAYRAIVDGKGDVYQTAQEAILANYKKGINDEFVVPAVINKMGMVKENDGCIVFNYRPDRLRELFSALTNPNFGEFERTFMSNLKLITMMPVSEEVIGTHAFELEKLENTFGEYISKLGMKQLRIAETEKYAHVTYFFDGGIEKELLGETRVLIPSPKVATYDLKPEMSAIEITDRLIHELESNFYDVVILNYANGDMVGHTGSFEATVKAVETLDSCLGKLNCVIKSLDGTLIVTADHGNCDTMLDEQNRIVTSHSTALVPFIVVKSGILLEDGKLGDIAPTILDLLGVEIPKEMSGKSLIKR